MTPDDAMRLVDRERVAASNKYPPFNSSHEGYAVMAEEVDELWDEVKRNPHKAPWSLQDDKVYNVRKHKEMMRAEAVQVAAMAIRFIIDCT